jgi:hypothetical protein
MIIYPIEFLSGAQSLMQTYVREYQYRVKLVSLEDVYNNFSGGHPDPVAIRNYMQFIQFNHPEPKPKGAVFLGSGTIDNRNFSGRASEKNRFIVNRVIAEGSLTTTQRYSTNRTSDDFFAYLTQSNYPERLVAIYISDDSR